jgi:hypothetical protein
VHLYLLSNITRPGDALQPFVEELGLLGRKLAGLAYLLFPSGQYHMIVKDAKSGCAKTTSQCEIGERRSDANT